MIEEYALRGKDKFAGILGVSRGSLGSFTFLAARDKFVEYINMPITSSAAKALRASKRKRVFNVRRKAEIDRTIKAFRKSVSVKDKTEAQKLIPAVYQALDKGVKAHQIKANTASRTKSRLMAALNKLV